MNTRLFFVFLAFLINTALYAAPGSKIVIDRVVATVDGDPITMSDVTELIPGATVNDFEAAKNNPAFRSALEQIITEKLLAFEGEARRINVTQQEVERYVENIAAHNSLSVDEFNAALLKEGKTLEQFKRSVRLEILRSKLASSLIDEGGGVTDSEVSEYIEEEYSNSEEGESQIKLRQVLIRNDKSQDQAATATCEEVLKKFNDGTPFQELARTYSHSPEGKTGGDLGVLHPKDLNPIIFDAILTVREGEVSPITQSPLGCHIFFVEKRFESAADSEALREEVRAKLNKQKVEEKFQTYFVSEIYKNHTVEKKI